MAKLSNDDIKHLADLARISVSDEEVIKYKKELESILGYVEQLNTIDTKSLDPTTQVTGLVNVNRDDKDISGTLRRSDLLDQVPEVKDGQIKVPKVL